LTRSQPGTQERALKDARVWFAVIPKLLQDWKFLKDKKRYLQGCFESIKLRWTGLLLFETFLFWKESESEVNEVKD